MLPKDGKAQPQQVGKGPEGEIREDEESKEMGKCGHGNAVAGPRAVVIHLGDAASAVSTVVGARGLRGRALVAPATVGLEDATVEDIAAWVDSDCAVVSEPEESEEKVEDDRLLARGRAGVEGRKVKDQLGKIAKKGDEEADGGHGKAPDEGDIVDAGHIDDRGTAVVRS